MYGSNNNKQKNDKFKYNSVSILVMYSDKEYRHSVAFSYKVACFVRNSHARVVFKNMENFSRNFRFHHEKI